MEKKVIEDLQEKATKQTESEPLVPVSSELFKEEPLIKQEKKQQTSVTVSEIKEPAPPVRVPTFQDLLTKAQQQTMDYNEEIERAKQFEQEQLPNLPELLQRDKKQARALIDKLVSSAKEITSSLITSLTSAPIHPYERLIYDYLGPNFKPPTIEDCSIPENYNTFVALEDLKQINNNTQTLILTQMAQITAEATAPGFEGVLSENLNHGFAELSVSSEGKQEWIVNKERLAEHLKFVEMVKNIPVDYITKNPLEVAKKIISEYTRIHKKENFQNVSSELEQTTKQTITNPFEEIKKLFGDYQKLNGKPDEYISTIFNMFDKRSEPSLVTTRQLN